VKAAKDEQAAVLANARLLKGQKLDPNNPRHAAFLDRAERANVFIDPEKWNDSASNEVEATIVDPENPTQTIRVSYQSRDRRRKGFRTGGIRPARGSKNRNDSRAN
jgi:hypothetical protein